MNNFFETGKKKSKKRPLGRFVRGLRALFNVALILGVCGVIIAACLYLFVAKQFEGDLDRTYPELAENSYVYDVNGNEIGEFPAAESRETVGFEGLGEPLPKAVVAVEDRRFYDHWGFAPRGSPARRGPTSGPGTSMRAAPR